MPGKLFRYGFEIKWTRKSKIFGLTHQTTTMTTMCTNAKSEMETAIVRTDSIRCDTAKMIIPIIMGCRLEIMAELVVW